MEITLKPGFDWVKDVSRRYCHQYPRDMMSGSSGHPPAGSAHRPFPSRPRRAARSVTLRHAPHHTSCTSTSAAPNKATSRTSATRKTSDAARSSFSSPCHRHVPLRTRRLSSLDGVLLFRASLSTSDSAVVCVWPQRARCRARQASPGEADTAALHILHVCLAPPAVDAPVPAFLPKLRTTKDSVSWYRQGIFHPKD